MKRGIKIEGAYDRHDNVVVRITKSRGRLTLDEIEDALRYGDGQRWCDHYAILLNCSESTVGGNGLYDFEEPPVGDTVDLYPIDDGEMCPICGNFTPPFTYCPTCGTFWKDVDLDVEKRLASMKEEAVREIERAKSPEAKLAWYWSHIGTLDLARQLDFITEARRQALCDEFKQYKPEPPTI